MKGTRGPAGAEAEQGPLPQKGPVQLGTERKEQPMLTKWGKCCKPVENNKGEINSACEGVLPLYE